MVRRAQFILVPAGSVCGCLAFFLLNVLQSYIPLPLVVPNKYMPVGDLPCAVYTRTVGSIVGNLPFSLIEF